MKKILKKIILWIMKIDFELGFRIQMSRLKKFDQETYSTIMANEKEVKEFGWAFYQNASLEEKLMAGMAFNEKLKK